MRRQRSMGSQATATKELLPRTVATVFIVYRVRTRACAGETSGAMGTVASVRDSGLPERLPTLATTTPTFAPGASFGRLATTTPTRGRPALWPTTRAQAANGSFPAEVLRRRTREQSPY